MKPVIQDRTEEHDFGPNKPRRIIQTAEGFKVDTGKAVIDKVLEEYAVVLKEAELQIEYLHERFGRTGSGEAVLARIRALKEQS